MGYGMVDWEFFDSQDFNLATGYNEGDKHKVAFVKSTGQYYVLKDAVSGAWASVGGLQSTLCLLYTSDAADDTR